MMGKPYYKRNAGQRYGAWVRDAAPPAGVNPNLQWNTYGSRSKLLQQFANERAMINNSTDAIYKLDYAFEGTGHAVYQHSLYYQQAGSWKLIRYDLSKRQIVAVNYLHHHRAAYHGNETLYKGLPGAVDFAVDQTGLWVIYANHKDQAARARTAYADWANDDVFFLAKLNPVDMSSEKIFKLNVPMNFRGNGFMVCGTLYIVRRSDRRRTSIAWTYDAYTEKQSLPKIAFTNPYGKTAQLSYDPRTNKILGWDSGRLILYPLLLRDTPV